MVTRRRQMTATNPVGKKPLHQYDPIDSQSKSGMSLQGTLPPRVPDDAPIEYTGDDDPPEDIEKALSGIYTEPRLTENACQPLRKLNEGTSGKIYLIRINGNASSKQGTEDGNESGGSLLACKVIWKDLANPLFVKKFLPRELDLLTRIRSQHCIQIHRVIETENKCFVFMRYAERGDLYDYLSSHGRLREEHAKFWVRQLALGVKYLQSMNVAHRDIKCENILVTEKLNVKLADFGFCRCWKEPVGKGEGYKEVLSSTYCGSLHYAAPEILAGTPYRLMYVDLWSLGVVLFVMLNGKFPFTGTALDEVRTKQLEKGFEFRPCVSKRLSKEVMKTVGSLLEPDVTRRATVNSLLNSAWMRHDPRLLKILPDEEVDLGAEETEE